MRVSSARNCICIDYYKSKKCGIRFAGIFRAPRMVARLLEFPRIFEV